MTITTSIVKTFQLSNLKVEHQDFEKEKIIQDTLDIALYCIPFYLRNSLPHQQLEGLPKSYLIPPSDPSPCVHYIAQLCLQMGVDHKSFFESLPKKLNLEIINARELYIKLCHNTFPNGIINWGRILSILTLACEFATEFAKNDEKNIIINIPMWIRDFVSESLVDWILEQGGWEEMTYTLSHNHSSKPWSGLLACTGLAVVAGSIVLLKGLGK